MSRGGGSGKRPFFVRQVVRPKVSRLPLRLLRESKGSENVPFSSGRSSARKSHDFLYPAPITPRTDTPLPKTYFHSEWYFRSGDTTSIQYPSGPLPGDNCR